jgi:hypothetical protein
MISKTICRVIDDYDYLTGWRTDPVDEALEVSRIASPGDRIVIIERCGNKHEFIAVRFAGLPAVDEVAS